MIEYTVKVNVNGSRYWLNNDILHREDGPAVEYASGYKAWYIHGKLHREDGPAVEYANGDRFWYLYGKEYTEKGFNKKINPVKELTIKEISDLLGYEIKIIKEK